MKYKNVSSVVQHLIGFGEIAKGEVIESSKEIYNASFELVEEVVEKVEKKTK